MQKTNRRAAITGIIFRAVLTIILAFGGGGAFAAQPERISDQAANEIAALMKEKGTWTPAQRKMESQLIHASKKNRGEVYAPGVTNLQMDVKFQPDGRILVDIKADVTPELLALIAQGGGTVVNQFPQFQAIRALVTPGQLETLAASADVKQIRRASRSHHSTGSVDSEGDTTHLAAAARAQYGVSGSGIKIGVLSDSVDFLTNSQATGDLGTVTILSGQSGVPGTGEGTAMLEIIHDLAPGAQLYFATASSGEASFAQNILNLRSAGCDIIVDDEAYFDESPFQDGVIAEAVNTVTAGGALYFSAAGNDGNLDSGASGTWEGDFVDGGAAPSSIETGRLHSFGSATYDTVGSGGGSQGADLFWSDPLGAATDDYDLFVLNSSGTSVVDSSQSVQDGSQDPYESVASVNPGERLVIVKYAGLGRFLHLDTTGGELSIATSGATKGHPTASNAFCVAAVDVATAYPNPFTGGSANPVETFSSDGPRRVFFNTNGTAITPGNFSSTGGATRQKPDITAADGVSVSVPGFTPFYGTSAAAPHAASIAALIKSYNPALTPAQIRTILTTTTLDIMTTGVDRDSGYGIVMANRALAATPSDAFSVKPATELFANGPAGGPFNGATQNFILTNVGTGSFSWTLINTSAWLSVSPTNGTLSSNGPSTTVTASLNAAASNLTVGSYTATLLFSNQATHVVQTRLFNLSVIPAPALSAYGNAVLALNPVAYWRLNETNRPPPAAVASNSGTLGVVATGFNADGVTQGLAGIVGTSFGYSNPTLDITYFGSHTDVQYLPVLNPNGPFTVEFWANPNQVTTDLFCPASSIDLTQNSGNSRLGWLFYQNSDNTWQFRLGGVSGYTATASGGTVQINAWQHIVGVYDGTNANLYVNGVNVSGAVSAAGFGPNASQPLRLGATTIPNRTFDGRVDEAAFYTKALSAATITAHYNTGKGNPAGYAAQVLASAPAGYWHLDDPASVVGALPVATNFGSLGANANGTYEPGTIPGVPGAPNAGFGSSNLACQFNGTSYILAPGAYLNFTNAMSVAAWVKASPATGFAQSIVSKGSNSYHLAMDATGHPRFGDGIQTVGDLAGAGRIDDGQWHHLTGVFNGVNTETLYVDGQSVSSTSAATGALSGNGFDAWLGADPEAGGVQYFNGVIDEVALFTNALSPGQVQQLYFQATNAPPLKFTGLMPQVNLQTLGLTWDAIVGRTYEVQYKTNLTQTTWSNLMSVMASNSVVSVTDGMNTNRQRFYRIVLLP